MGVVGAAIKGFGKALKRNKASKQVFNRTTGKPFPKSIQDHMKAADKRVKGMKKAGYRGPKHEFYETKKPGSYRVREVWKYNPYKTLDKAIPSKKSKAKKVLKKAAPLAAAGAAGVAYEKSKGKK